MILSRVIRAQKARTLAQVSDTMNIHKHATTLYRKLKANQRLVLFVTAFAIIATVTLIRSFAFNPYTSIIVSYSDTAEISRQIQIIDSAETSVLDLSPSTWQETTTMPGMHYESSILAIDNRIYVLGGNESTEVIFAKPNTDGTVSEWRKNPYDLPYEGRLGAALQVGDFVYFIGGYTNELGAMDEAHIGRINSDGTIGPWVRSNATPGPGPIHAHVLFSTKAVNNDTYLYAYGGGDNNTSRSISSKAKIINSSTGELGPWQTFSSEPLNYANAAVIGNYVYLLGGGDDTTYNNQYGQVRRATIDQQTGEISAFMHIGTMPGPNYDGAGISYGGKLYYHGGGQGSDINSDGFSSTIANLSDGTLAPWQTATSATKRLHHGMAIVAVNENHFIYLVGGYIYGDPWPLTEDIFTRQVYFSKLIPRNADNIIVP